MLYLRTVAGGGVVFARRAPLPVRKLHVCMNLYSVLHEADATPGEARAMLEGVWATIVRGACCQLSAPLAEVRVYWTWAQRGIETAMGHPLRLNTLEVREQRALATRAWGRLVRERARARALRAVLPEELCERVMCG